MEARNAIPPITRCDQCDVGVSAGVRDGRSCPFEDTARAAGSVLLRAGDPADTIWFVKRGTVVLYRGGSPSPYGRVRAVRFPGALFGLEALVSDSFLDTAVAASAVEICGLQRERMDDWLGPADSRARLALEMTLRAECKDVVRQAAPDGSALQRVAAWLQQDAQNLTEFAIPRKLIADLLGMRAETLSRALRELSDRGAICVKRSGLQILSERALDEIALTR